MHSLSIGYNIFIMFHEMKLQSSPFQKIKDGTKTIELRLFDEKRQQLKLGDEIEFSLIDSPDEKLLTEVVGLLRYKSFQDLYKDYLPEVIGSETKDDWRLMRKYYSEEDEKRFGVLGIRVNIK